MKKQFLTLIISALTTISVQAKTNICTQAKTEKKALSAALCLEKLNSGGAPITTEIYSLSSQYDTYGVILSYSGIQHIWIVNVDSEQCLIKSIELK